MNVRVQAEKAEQFRKLHHGPRMLVLANAWDVVSARILEECGHPAIATSSAAVAFSRGYPDGQRIPRDEMLDVVGRIARAVRVPVTADLESGYCTTRSEEHTSELQSPMYLVCRLLLEKKKIRVQEQIITIASIDIH